MDSVRWENIAKARAAYECGAPTTGDGPIEAFFEIAARCNLRCRMCAIVYDTRYRPSSGRPPIFAPELFERLASAFPTIVRAYLFGLGEPLLNPHLPEYVRRLASGGAEVWFNTNATLIDDAKAEQLAANGAQRITVSIDGATPETYERIRRGARFTDVIRGISALVEAGKRHGNPKVNLSFVAMRSNIEELPRMADLCAELGATGVHVEPLYSQQQSDLERHYAEENLGNIDLERIEQIFAETKRRALANGVDVASRFLSGNGSFDYVERAPTLPVSWVCTEPWSSIWVTAAGEVRTCCINETSFGNLFEQPFEEIWNGPMFRRFREQHARRTGVPEGCGNCIRNGRPRHSPFFEAVQTVTYRPLEFALGEAPSHSRIEWPAEGETITDPLVVTGRSDGNSTSISWDVMIDHERITSFDQSSFTPDGRFILHGRVPFLTEGAHVLWLRESGSGGMRGWGHRKVYFWRGDNHGSHAATRLAAFEFPVPPDEVRVDGERSEAFELIFRRDGPPLALVDTTTLGAGPHEIEFWLAGERRALTLQLLK